jgi:hypothetical protein
MDVSEALRSPDMDEIIDAMNAYAISRLNSVKLKDFNGKQPVDFVGDLLLKVAEGTRDWSKAKCTFREFLFGCLRSDIDSFFNTKKNIHTNKFPKDTIDGHSENHGEEKSKLVDLLKQAGADEIELTLFECWMDGITKPSEIKKETGLEITVIYASIKRLERRIEKTKEQAKHII